jgi:hypothetical protein
LSRNFLNRAQSNQPETDVPIPRRAVVKFKPSKEMSETVRKLSPGLQAENRAKFDTQPPIAQ